MTNEQINAAIAEACGIVGKDQYGPLYQTPDGWVVDCPQFATCLNAMHEAEHKLPYVQLCNYIDLLIEFSPEAAVATSRQRAEAFLRTLGKWEEVQG
jgi:hypothetical protein